MKRKWLVLALLTLCASGSGWAAEYAGYKAKSDKPLRYFVRLGPDEKAPRMLIVLDESKGTGKGYDVAMADLNLNGKLDDEKSIEGNTQQKERCEFRINAVAPFREVDPKAKYGVAIILYKSEGAAAMQAPFIYANLEIKSGADTWTYMFMNSIPKTDPKDAGLTLLSFGTPVTMTTNAAQQALPKEDNKPAGQGLAISATMKDADGQILRVAQHQQKEVQPHLLVKSPGGKTVEEKDMEYG